MVIDEKTRLSAHVTCRPPYPAMGACKPSFNLTSTKTPFSFFLFWYNNIACLSSNCRYHQNLPSRTHTLFVNSFDLRAQKLVLLFDQDADVLPRTSGNRSCSRLGANDPLLPQGHLPSLKASHFRPYSWNCCAKHRARARH